MYKKSRKRKKLEYELDAYKNYGKPSLSKTHGTIPNYWLKAFPATHSYFTKIFNTITGEPKQMPDWLTGRKSKI
jgi:hypothetical protein